MTIAVAVRTNSSIVFATDSKLTAQGIAGFNPDGSTRWVEQTYDNATKVVHDRNKRLIALGAGHANLGRVGVTDFLATQWFPECADTEAEDAALIEIATCLATSPRHWRRR